MQLYLILNSIPFESSLKTGIHKPSPHSNWDIFAHLLEKCDELDDVLHWNSAEEKASLQHPVPVNRKTPKSILNWFIK